MAVERNLSSWRSTTQEEFEKLLQKQCPWHPETKHSAIECYNLHKTFKAPPLHKSDKKESKEKEDDDHEDK